MLILNSTYTGGELEVTHGGRTEVVTGLYSWVAMYGDCLHKINRVTSGARVSLIYDIYAAPLPFVSKTELENIDCINTVWDSAVQDADKAYGVSETVKALILTSLNSERETSDCIYIALQHLYPNYLDDQLVPSALNRGDRSLYDTIRDSQFDVTFRMVTICQTSQERMDEFYSFSYCCSATAQLMIFHLNDYFRMHARWTLRAARLLNCMIQLCNQQQRSL